MKMVRDHKINKISLTSFMLIVLSGAILLYSYYYLGTTNSRIVGKLWGRINDTPNLTKVYVLSMFLSAFGFLYTLYYLSKTRSLSHKETHLIPMSFIAIIIASLFWMPLSFKYLTAKKKSQYLKYAIIGVLSIVAFSSLYSTALINNIKERNYKLQHNIATYGMIYFFIHTFFLDNLIWSYNFF